MPFVVLTRKQRESDTPEAALRKVWGQNLADELDAKRMSVKQFHLALSDAGASVSIQAVYGWIKGTNSPSPTNQAYCAHVLRAPGHRLFPLPRVDV